MTAVTFLDLGKRYVDVPAADRVVAALRLARAAELAGAERYWLAEHHVPDTALHAPEVVLPLVAAATERIRVGAAGVLLRYHSPLKVWEQYTTLAAAFGDRVDLGVCRGPGVADDAVAAALVGSPEELQPHGYPAKVLELARLAREGTGARGLVSPAVPRVWVLGSGPGSAALAAQLGVGVGVDEGVGEEAVDVRDETVGAGSEREAGRGAASTRPGFAAMCFHPGSVEAVATLPLRPHVVAITVTAGVDDESAARADAEHVRGGKLPAMVTGGITTCADRLAEIAAQLGVGELALACLSPRMSDQQDLVEVIGELATRARAARNLRSQEAQAQNRKPATALLS